MIYTSLYKLSYHNTHTNKYKDRTDNKIPRYCLTKKLPSRNTQCHRHHSRHNNRHIRSWHLSSIQQTIRNIQWCQRESKDNHCGMYSESRMLISPKEPQHQANDSKGQSSNSVAYVRRIWWEKFETNSHTCPAHDRKKKKSSNWW
jgi:hypothetical protein